MYYQVENGHERDVLISLGNISDDDLSRGKFFDKVGFEPYRVPIEPLIGRVIAGDPAALAGIRSGDRVISADGNDITTWLEWVEYVRARPEEAINVILQRDSVRLTLSMTPKRCKLSMQCETVFMRMRVLRVSITMQRQKTRKAD